MAEKLGEAFLELTARDGKLKAALAGAERRSRGIVGRIGAQFKKLGGDITGSIVKGMAVFALFQRGVNELGAGINRAMRLEGLANAFENLAGKGDQATFMLHEMNAAFRGTVEQTTALEIANNALLLGVVTNAKEMAFLAMAGRRLGKAVGKDAAFGVNSLVVGIGRQSKLMLDNLGIIINVEKAYGDYATQLGKVAAKLTDAEKKQAFMNATMDATREKLSRLGADVEDAGEKWQKFKASWGNVFTAIGSGILKTAEGFHDFIRAYVRGINEMNVPGTTRALIYTQQQIIDNEKQQVALGERNAEILAQRAKREGEIKKEKKKQLKLDKKRKELAEKTAAKEQKLWEDGEKIRERLFIAELRLRGENLKAALLAIELEKKALMEKATTIKQAAQIEKWAIAAVAAEKIKVEEKKQEKLKELRDKGTREIEEHRREVAAVEAKEKEEDKRGRAWFSKSANLQVRWLRKIGAAREADRLALELWRKAEINAAEGSVDRLALIDRLYRASLSDIEKIKSETRNPQWMGAEQLWKRAVTITKGAEPKTAVQVMTLATKEDKEALKESKEQTRLLTEINAKEGGQAVLK
jgi:hypothetical protein